MMISKIIEFLADEDTRVIDLNHMARMWYESNKDNIHILSSAYGKKLNPEDNNYHVEKLTILYEADEDAVLVPSQQECEHATTKDVIRVAASCNHPGQKDTVCTVCGKIMNSTALSSIAHNYVFTSNGDATCTEDGTKTGTCSVCGGKIVLPDEGSALGHDFSEWGIFTQPTYDSAGKKMRSCSKCKCREYKEVSALTVDDFEITTTTLPDALTGRLYAYELASNVPEELSVLYEATGLPDGIYLDGRDMTGTAEVAGEYTVDIMAAVKNNLGITLATATKELTLKVIDSTKTITFDPNGGTVDTTSKKYTDGDMIGKLPIPVKEGSIFGGWFTAAVGGLKVDENMSVTTSMTVYARWGESSDIVFGDATTQFNIHVNGDRTNYQDHPYDLYQRCHDGSDSDLIFQTGISSVDGTNNMSDTNPEIILYLKITNNGEAGAFDVGFHCDSYVVGNNNDDVVIERIEKGVSLGGLFTVTADTNVSAWLGLYSDREEHLFEDVPIGTKYGKGVENDTDRADSGYAFCMNNVFINSSSYTIVPVSFKMI